MPISEEEYEMQQYVLDREKHFEMCIREWAQHQQDKEDAPLFFWKETAHEV
ncbi:MAG: hypothetical protein IMZ70_05840 [Candidatus Atribacteria bacterium]|nr:hypothetical protein [Candidatus Atribacteria bacterium]